MPYKTYRSAADFRRALEDRLQDIAKKEAIDLQRIRREVAFDRLLVRLFRGERPDKLPWALKGGYAMELRIQSAQRMNQESLHFWRSRPVLCMLSV